MSRKREDVFSKCRGFLHFGSVIQRKRGGGGGGWSYYRYKEMTPKETESVKTKGGIEQGAAPYKQKQATHTHCYETK